MDHYSVATARTALPCSKEQFDNIQHLIEEEWESDSPCSLNCVYTSDGKIWFYTDESCYPENIDNELVLAIAEMVRQNGENYLEFGVACYGSRNVIDGNSGYCFRINSGEEVEFQQALWISAPEETEVGRLILDLIQTSRCALADMEGLALDEIDNHPASETIQELRDVISRAERMGFGPHSTHTEERDQTVGCAFDEETAQRVAHSLDLLQVSEMLLSHYDECCLGADSWDIFREAVARSRDMS